MIIKEIGEIGLIHRLTKNLKQDKSVIKGPGDDAAVIEWTSKKYLLMTSDILVEDIHFRRSSATPYQIGWKAMVRNISDIAAMGGLPRYATISMALPSKTALSYADGIYKGIKSSAKQFGVNVVGGDLSSSENIVIDIALLGEVEKDRLVRRSGANAGDLILLTGTVGGSSKGKHLDFVPRVEASRLITEKYSVSSMIDVSDGLLIDLWRILDASGVGAKIHQSIIPLSSHARSFDRAVREGEDFELLFTMSNNEARKFFTKMLAKMKTPVTLIGEITRKRDGYRLIREDGKTEKIKTDGYLHFSR